MSFIQWDESYSVNIEIIDMQHKRILAFINDFYENIKSKSSEESMAFLLKDMRSYSLLHFNTEEKLFLKHNFPEAKKHIAEHQRYLEKVTDFEKRFRDKTLTNSFELTNYLKKWIIEHIKGSDKHYTVFLNEKGEY